MAEETTEKKEESEEEKKKSIVGHPWIESLIYFVPIALVIWFKLRFFITMIFSPITLFLSRFIPFMSTNLSTLLWSLLFVSIFFLTYNSVRNSIVKEKKEGSSRIINRVLGCAVCSVFLFVIPVIVTGIMSLIGPMLSTYIPSSAFSDASFYFSLALKCGISDYQCYQSMMEEREKTKEKKVEIPEIIKFEVEKKTTYSPNSELRIKIKVIASSL